MMPLLEARGLSCGYGGKAIVHGASFSLAQKDTLSILGPNGVGKTTLFRTILGLMPAIAGSVLVDGEDTAGWDRRRLAQAMGYVPQGHAASLPFSCFEVVLMGRTPRLSRMENVSGHDREVAGRAMDELSIAHLADRDFNELSGGERQMVLIARALAQEPRILIMDEPTSSLDFANQAHVIARIAELSDSGLAVVITTHDPNQAFMLGGSVAMLGRDGSLSIGSVGGSLTEEALSSLYGVEVGMGAVASASGRKLRVCAPLCGASSSVDAGGDA